MAKNSICKNCLCSFCDKLSCKEKYQHSCLSCLYKLPMYECNNFNHTIRNRKKIILRRKLNGLSTVDLLRLKLLLDDIFDKNIIETLKKGK